MVFGKWEAIRQLGQGGQGTVWLVRNASNRSRDLARVIGERVRTLGQGLVTTKPRDSIEDELLAAIRDVIQLERPENLGALKLIRTDGRELNDSIGSQRFGREIAALRTLNHDSLIKILDDDPNGRWYVSEYLPNGRLTDRQFRFSGRVAESLRMLRPIVEATAVLHENGLIHRDIKPDNILFSGDESPKLCDFGLVFRRDAVYENNRLSGSCENVGSWEWMPLWAQETRMEEVSPKFDVFSIAKMLWWLVSGLPVTRLKTWDFGDEDTDIRRLHPTARHTEMLQRLLRKCITKKECECEIASARELLQQIDRIVQVADHNADLVDAPEIRILNYQRKCPVCGLGRMNLVVNGNMWQAVGVCSSVGSIHCRVECCSECGNIAVFAASNSNE